jgi:hypothetical protein
MPVSFRFYNVKETCIKVRNLKSKVGTWKPFASSLLEDEVMSEKNRSELWEICLGNSEVGQRKALDLEKG